MDKSVEYNALCLAKYECAMCSNDVIRVCLLRKHNLISQFQHNLMWFSHSRHVNLQILQRILMLDLGALSLRKLAALRAELEMSFFAVEFYGINFYPREPY